MERGKEKLKVGVVGLGKMGLLHASILSTLPNVTLTAVCDKSSLITKFARKALKGVYVTDDLLELKSLGLDAVYVTTPTLTHFRVLKTLYHDGIARNVFVEKPLSANYAEAEELCRLARRGEGVNMVGYQRRFSVTFRKAKELLEQDVIGEIASFQAYAYSSDFLGAKGKLRATASRGGVLRDLGCHAIDVALWFFGDIQVTSAEMKSLIGEGSEDDFHFNVKGPNGLEGEFRVSWCEAGYRMPEVGMVVKGTKGTVKVSDDKVELRLNDGETRVWYRHDLNDNVGFLLGGPEYFREDEHFIRSVLEGRVAEPSFCTAAKVDYVINQVRSAVGKGG